MEAAATRQSDNIATITDSLFLKKGALVIYRQNSHQAHQVVLITLNP